MVAPVTIFRKFSFYLAILGILTAILFIHVTEKPLPPAEYAQRPSGSPFAHYLAGSGIVEAVDKNIEIGVPEDAIVQNLYVKVGDLVKKGEPLFKLDTRQLEAEQLVSKGRRGGGTG